MNVFTVAIGEPKTADFSIGAVDRRSSNDVADEQNVPPGLRSLLLEIGYNLG